jgi:hypothetical protein
LPFLQEDLNEAYAKAQKAARRDGGILPVYSDRHSGELTLGIAEVPLKKIKGTYSESRRAAFAENYMPLLPDDSEFSRKWRQVLDAHLTEGLREPLVLYEYLGYYYVLEGNKRVSVLRYSGAYSYHARITRLLPPADADDDETAVFYELIGARRRKLLRHLWFSRPGVYTRLLETADEQAIDSAFTDFRRQYHNLGFGGLPLTTGDAFAEYVSVYGLADRPDEDGLRANIRKCGVHFAHAPGGLPAPVPLLRSPKLSMAFIIAGLPEESRFAAMHEEGRLALREILPQHETKAFFVRSGEDGGEYGAASEAAEWCRKGGGMLFFTNTGSDIAALRASIEHKDLRVMRCTPGNTRGALTSYYGDTWEMAFLCGVLASYLSESGRVGYIRPPAESGVLPEDFGSFARGAAATRACSRAEETVPARYDAAHISDCCRELANRGCDIALVPRVYGTYPEGFAFASAYARLVRLLPGGRVGETYAMPAWHWGQMYRELARGTENVPAFRLGVSSGLLRAHICHSDASRALSRLCGGFSSFIASFLPTADG